MFLCGVLSVTRSFPWQRCNEAIIAPFLRPLLSPGFFQIFTHLILGTKEGNSLSEDYIIIIIDATTLEVEMDLASFKRRGKT